MKASRNPGDEGAGRPEAPDGPDAPDRPESYEGASERLEQIIARLDSGDAELRETLALCVEAKGLIEFCKGELDAVSGQLRELDLDTLVAELERPDGDPEA
jgi:exodeoxyribonuclease VII small subunit